MASLIIEALSGRKACPVLFFYCKHDQQEKSTFAHILRGLLAQFLCQDDALVAHFYDRCTSKNQAGMSAMLEELAKDAFHNQKHSFVILDGLDECEPAEAERAISWFISLQKDSEVADSGQVRLLCIGQRVYALERMLTSAVDISLENDMHQEDIKRYVKEQARHIREEFEISSEIEKDIVNRTTDAANSMYSTSLLIISRV